MCQVSLLDNSSAAPKQADVQIQVCSCKKKDVPVQLFQTADIHHFLVDQEASLSCDQLTKSPLFGYNGAK